MVNQLHLNKPWEQFRTELQQYVVSGKILKTCTVNSREDFDLLEADRLSWEREVFAWLNGSFANEINPLVIELNNVAANNFTVHFASPSLKDEVFQLMGRIQMKVNFLLLKERILSVCEVITSPDSEQLNDRGAMTLKQKQRFVLEKLFDLYDDNFYPVEDILTGNGIKLNRNSEADELAATLEKSGHLETRHFKGQKLIAQLTAKGAMLIEESRQPVLENYEEIRFSASELAQKMEEIKIELNKQNLGHEILFDELQELKNLYTTLNKKNWGQLLKGKLLDIAIGKLVDNATIGFVYEALTDHKLKLL